MYWYCVVHCSSRYVRYISLHTLCLLQSPGGQVQPLALTTRLSREVLRFSPPEILRFPANAAGTRSPGHCAGESCRGSRILQNWGCAVWLGGHNRYLAHWSSKRLAYGGGNYDSDTGSSLKQPLFAGVCSMCKVKQQPFRNLIAFSDAQCL